MNNSHASIKFDIQHKLLQFLIMLYITINLIGIPVTYKLIVMGPLIGPGGLAALPFMFLIEDIIVELYGYKISRFLLWLILSSTIIFSLACVAIIHMPSPNGWNLQENYNVVFDPILKSGPSSVIAIFIGQFINLVLMVKWKILLKGRHFWLRSIFSTLLSSMCSLLVFFSLSFLGRVPFSTVEALFLSDLAVRLGYTIIGGIPVAFLVRYLKNKLGIDAHDKSIDFNPFSLDTKN